MKTRLTLAAAMLMASAAPVLADVNVCVTVSATGPAASLGVPERNTVEFLPTEAGGQKINYIVFDDATDPTNATLNVRKCLTENAGDVIVGSSATPPSIAAAGVAAETKTAVIALAPVGVDPSVEPWTFRAPQNIAQMASALLEHMQANNVKNIGFIGYSDGYGEQWLQTITPMLKEAGITLDPVERFARTDTSVTGQVLKLVSANPEAILVVASGTPAALPNIALSERGYQGQVYHTHGSASRDFIRVAGAAAEGSIMPVGPLVAGAQLPDDHPSKAAALEYTKLYEEKHGAGSISSFGGHMWDAGQLLVAAIPVALEKAQPGTAEFRQAMRDALEGVQEVAGVHGVFNMKPDDHFGHDERSRVLVTVENGDWKYLGGE
jgi:branched-chain amino acid transport system substrate-binding protein